jgi:hypothetical protein
MANQSPPKQPHTSPLRRSIRKAISLEDPEEELLEDKLPFRFMVGKNLERQISKPFVRWRRVDTGEAQPIDPDDQDIVKIVTRALTSRYIHYVRQDIYQALERCESPIERTMLGAIVAVAVKNGIGIQFRERFAEFFWYMERGRHPSRNSATMLTITPQAEFGEYRADILLGLDYVHTEFPPESFTEFERDGESPPMRVVTRPDLVKRTRVKKNLIIECDGHEFHEKTKAQAARDKKRDRTLQSLGYVVIRFTGSEVYNDPIACAEEALECLYKDREAREPMERP